VQEGRALHGTDLAVAKEPGQAKRAQAALDQFGVVVRASEKILAAAIAATWVPVLSIIAKLWPGMSKGDRRQLVACNISIDTYFLSR